MRNICDWLWKRKSNWFWNIIWHIVGCHTPTVSVLICKETRLVANQWCIYAGTSELREYRVGSEPTEVCYTHKEPEPPEPIPPPSPPIVYPDPIPIMGFQGAGGFNYFKITKNQEETLKLIKEIRMHGYYLNDAFMFLSDNKAEHANLKLKTPWVYDGKFHLTEWNQEFWDDFETYLEIHKEVGLDFCSQLWMREDYINAPYGNNVDGIRGFWDAQAMPVHRKYVRKVMGTYRKVYGTDYKPWVKVSPNEVAHVGSGKKFHRIMYFCEDIWENVLQAYTTLDHIICDLTGCEGTIGELREPHDCPKPSDCDRGGRHGKKGCNRLAVGEKHERSVWEDFPDLPRLFLVNKTRRFTEDGGSMTKGGGITLPNGINLGTPGQQGYMMRNLAQFYKATGRKAIFCSFPHEALKFKDGVFFPDYRVSEMKRVWACAKEMQREYWEVMG